MPFGRDVYMNLCVRCFFLDNHDLHLDIRRVVENYHQCIFVL